MMTSQRAGRWYDRCTVFQIMNAHQVAKLLASFVFLLSLSWCPESFAQRPIWEGAGSVGSGLSFGTGAGGTAMKQSPIYIDVDIIYANDESPSLEYVVGFQAELQGRVSAGIVPQVRLSNAPSALMVYGILGAPIVVAPFTLFGVEAGGGLLWRATKRFGIFGEVVLDLFIFGNDLPNKATLTQIDANFGGRVTF